MKTKRKYIRKLANLPIVVRKSIDLGLVMDRELYYHICMELGGEGFHPSDHWDKNVLTNLVENIEEHISDEKTRQILFRLKTLLAHPQWTDDIMFRIHD
jgi:hypothetical protein